ncbi:MAG: outer membrane beta-barrel protein [Burkholderiales bacterium]|nr:outer membrane beta-barrel protein [Burkholderiales bacterium]
MNQDTRIDTTNGVSASANWTPTRNSQVSATLSYDTRDSNRQLTDFKATTFFVSAQLNF